MAQSAEIRHDVGFLSTLPLGSIIAWHRDLLANRLLELPPGWVECNGQKLDDPESPFHGNIIPNLNLVDRDDPLAGHEGGAFLRGAPKSGDFQQDQLQSHTHRDAGHAHPRNPEGRAERVLIVPDEQGDGHRPEGGDGNSTPVGELTGEGRARLSNPTASGAGPPRHGAETRPVNMSVIWVMKVKQITAAQALPVVLAHAEAPHGAVYVDQGGRVGVGTDSPSTEFEVAGGLRLGAGATVRSISTSLGSRSDALASEKAIRDYIDGATTLRRHAFESVYFLPVDVAGTEKTVVVGFAPRVLLVAGQVFFDTETVGLQQGPVNGFANIEGESQINAIATIPVLTVTGETVGETSWRMTADNREGLGGFIYGEEVRAGQSRFEALVGPPVPTEDGFAVGFKVTPPEGLPIGFSIQLHFLCMG